MPIVITAAHINALKIVPIISSSLSVIGSTCLIYLISKVKKNKKTPLLRLLLVLSIADVLHSINWSLGTIPNIEGYAIGARGNEATCTASGFVTYGIGGLLPFYNACIMIYFLLTIRYGWKTEHFEKTHIEKIMHALSAGVPIISGTILAIIGYINPTPYALGRCYIQAFPPNCDVTNDGQCQRGQHARIVRWTLALGPYIICYIFLLFSVFLIAWTVRRQARTMSRYSATNSVNIERRVILQSILYGSVFFMTYFWGLFMMVANLVPEKDESSIRSWLYPIQMLREIFYPLQGFCNLMIYLNGQRLPSNRGRIFMFSHIGDRLREMSKSAKSAFKSTKFFSMESDDIIDLDVDDLDSEDDSDIEKGSDNGFEGSSSHKTKGSDGTEETTLPCSGTTTHQEAVAHQSKDEGLDNSTTSTTKLNF